MVPGTVYRVVRHVGTGGMGTLYEVEDTTVGRHYVLKTLNPEMVERRDLIVRMQEEARALGRLHHPNIVEVITAGVVDDTVKVPFYVMERLVGQNLRTVIDTRKGAPNGVGLANAYRIAIDVLGALQHAHESGMVHRDVKPENIFLHRGATGTVTKLLDFGIVRMLNREGSLTRGKFIGTLRYSAPEQVTGSGAIGPATDVYAAGLVLYELLTGRGPFDDEGDAFKIGSAHVARMPLSPSRLGATVPVEVDGLLLQALAKAPEARPTCVSFVDQLRRALVELERSPAKATDVDLLSAQHSVSGASTLRVDMGAPRVDMGAPRVDMSVPTQQEAPPTRVEGMAVADTVAARTPLMPGVTPRRHLDREAPTRMTPRSEPRVIVASNDTSVAEGQPGSRSPVTPRITLKMETPKTDPSARKTNQYVSTVHTRPQKGMDRAVFALIAAAMLALAMIAGAFVIVRHARAAPPVVPATPK